MHKCPICGDDCDCSNESDCNHECKIEPIEPAPFERPAISDELKLDVLKMAKKINSCHDQRVRLPYLIAILSENALLTAEVNQHRATLGFELLPVYDPITGKVKK